MVERMLARQAGMRGAEGRDIPRVPFEFDGRTYDAACPRCGSPLAVDLAYCLVCGRELRSVQRVQARGPFLRGPRLRSRAAAVGALVVALIVGGVITLARVAPTYSEADVIRQANAAAVDVMFAKLSGDLFLAAREGRDVTRPLTLDAAVSAARDAQQRLRDIRAGSGIVAYHDRVIAWAAQVVDGLVALRDSASQDAGRSAWAKVDADPEATRVSVSDAYAVNAADSAAETLAAGLAAARSAAEKADAAALWRFVAQIDVERVWLQALLRSEPASGIFPPNAYWRGPGLLRPIGAPLTRCFRGTATTAQQPCRYAYGALVEWAADARDAAARAAQSGSGRKPLDDVPPPDPNKPPQSDYQARLSACLAAGGTWVGAPLGGGEYCQIRGSVKFALNPFGVLPTGTAGLAYAATITASATGGTPPYRFYRDPTGPGLPLGLVLGDDGRISGVPTTTASGQKVAICATDRNGVEACARGELTVASTPLVLASEQKLPDATLGAPYAAALCQPASAMTATGCGTRGGTATNPRGGVPPYTFNGPSEPSWFTVAANGTIQGTPSAGTTTGTYTICVQDSSGQRQCGPLVFTVIPAIDLDTVFVQLRERFAATYAPVRIDTLRCDKGGRVAVPASSACTYVDTAAGRGAISVRVNADMTWAWSATPTATVPAPVAAAPVAASPVATPPATVAPPVVAASFAIATKTCAPNPYNTYILTARGTATGPVLSTFRIEGSGGGASVSCGQWTRYFDNCTRHDGDPASTTWSITPVTYTTRWTFRFNSQDFVVRCP